MSEYSIGNQKLEYCDMKRDLGVIISTDLKVEYQCSQACMKANKSWVNKENICYKVT